VSPEEFERYLVLGAPFQRETRLPASFSHPNIPSIYGLGESGKSHSLILELVEGETPIGFIHNP
jgi:serine/threonine protein kinase